MPLVAPGITFDHEGKKINIDKVDADRLNKKTPAVKKVLDVNTETEIPNVVEVSDIYAGLRFQADLAII